MQEGSPREVPEQRTRCLHRDSTEVGPGRCKTLPKPSSAPSGGRGECRDAALPGPLPQPSLPSCKETEAQVAPVEKSGFSNCPTNAQNSAGTRLNTGRAELALCAKHGAQKTQSLPQGEGSEERRQNTAGTPSSQR